MHENLPTEVRPKVSQYGVSGPGLENDFLSEHAAILLNSYRRLIGSEMISSSLSPVEQASELFHAPFAVVSHGVEEDPVFNYANQKALELFEYEWEVFTSLPSRLSAEPVHRDERARLLASVTERGCIDNYRGVRIASSGRRFWIEDAVVWNLTDDCGSNLGQAAAFRTWRDV